MGSVLDPTPSAQTRGLNISGPSPNDLTRTGFGVFSHEATPFGPRSRMTSVFKSSVLICCLTTICYVNLISSRSRIISVFKSSSKPHLTFLLLPLIWTWSVRWVKQILLENVRQSVIGVIYFIGFQIKYL